MLYQNSCYANTTKNAMGADVFSTSLTTDTIAFTHSIEADTRLIGYDIWGSQAHAIMLARQEIISEADLREILRWLRKVEKDFQNGNFTLDPNKEDVHMNVESYLIEKRRAGIRGQTPHRSFPQRSGYLSMHTSTSETKSSISSADSPNSAMLSYTLQKHIPTPSCRVIHIHSTPSRSASVFGQPLMSVCSYGIRNVCKLLMHSPI